MSTHILTDNSGMQCIITCPNIYSFEGYIFENHYYCGPIRCKKNLEPYDRVVGPRSKFWDVFERWNKLTVDEKKKTCIYS